MIEKKLERNITGYAILYILCISLTIWQKRTGKTEKIEQYATVLLRSLPSFFT